MNIHAVSVGKCNWRSSPLDLDEAGGHLTVFTELQSCLRWIVLCQELNFNWGQRRVKKLQLPLRAADHQHGSGGVVGYYSREQLCSGQQSHLVVGFVQNYWRVLTAQHQFVFCHIPAAADGPGSQRDPGDGGALDPVPDALVDAAVGHGLLGCGHRVLHRQHLVGLQRAEPGIEGVPLRADVTQHLAKIQSLLVLICSDLLSKIGCCKCAFARVSHKQAFSKQSSEIYSFNVEKVNSLD